MKNYRIEYQPSAEDDLFAIWLYIARDSIKQADRWVELLKDRSERLSEFPEKGRPYKGEYRLLPIDNGYRIYYRIDEPRKIVVIIHFFNPYQDIDRRT